ncbi:MAG: type I-B CRISPR-associated protein Cas8b1/Cst1 [Candidatus Omnitrophota bacterium]
MNEFCSPIVCCHFSWMQYDFMKNALLAVIFITPLFALLGTMVVNNRMAFFSDVLGHSALTGIALGVMLGVGDPFWALLIFTIILAVAVNYFKRVTKSSPDTTLGVFFAMVVAGGVVILSRNGGFSKYTTYLIGDILAISGREIKLLIMAFLLVTGYWCVFGNSLLLVSVNPSLARSRGVKVFWVETSFVIVLAVIVAISIRLVGILIINSLLILPAATSRLIARDTSRYTFYSIGISLVCGASGLIASYYWNTASGATIVLLCAFVYVLVTFSARFLPNKA